jgi:DNA-binding response OmpR family regulator
MRVLVVDDDKALGAFLKKGMELEGHRVTWVGDGEAALAHAESDRPDLIVLDLSLPKRDGMEVLEELRARNHDASVLVLTGRSDLDARLRCLDLGADDCLLKPFSFYELMARTRALLRRREQFSDPVLRLGDLQLNRMEHKVVRGDRTIDLTAREYSLLEFLLLHQGECVSRGALLTGAWQMPAEAGTNVVDVYINYLRRKLSPPGAAQNPQQPEQPEPKDSLIETVRGSGYRIGAAGSKPIGLTASTHAACAYRKPNPTFQRKSFRMPGCRGPPPWQLHRYGWDVICSSALVPLPDPTPK